MTATAPTDTAPTLAARIASRARQWSKIFALFFTAQTLNQALGLVAGLLIVNVLTVREFALYTLGTSVATFFNSVTDLGSTSSLIYFFRASTGQPDTNLFRDAYAAVVSLRRGAFLVGALVVVIVFPYIALKKGFAPTAIALALLAVLATVWFQIAASVRLLTQRLTGQLTASYRAELAGAGTRFALAATLLALAAPPGWLALYTGAAATALIAGLAHPPDTIRHGGDPRRARRQVLRYLLPSLPSAAYFSLQGPLIIWLCAAFGTTSNIAEVGAVGRLGMVVSLFTTLGGSVFLPRLAAVRDERLFLRRYLQFACFQAAIGAALFALAWFFPSLLLALLGPHYKGLQRELLLVVASAGISLVAGFGVAVNLARSWNRLEGVAVSVLIVAQAILVAVLPMNDTHGVLVFSLLTSCVSFALQILVSTIGFVRPRWVQWMP